MGQYTQQDPIGLEGNNPTLYGYVVDTNIWIDPLGLSGRGGDLHREIQDRLVNDLRRANPNAIVRPEGQIRLPNGRFRFGGVVVTDPATRQIREVHQIGDMRTRGGFRPSARERGAIMDIRQSHRNARIVFHDKHGRVTLINPDQKPGWRNPANRHRHSSGC